MVEEQQPQQPPTGTVVDLGRKVKAKYPGVYDSLPDDEVGRKVKEKYPGAYDGFSDVTPQQPPAPAVPGKPQAPSAPMASPSTSVAGSSPVGSGAGQATPEFVPPELPPDLIGASRITQEPDMASVAVDQTNTLMTPGEQEFRKEFAPMDLAAVKEFKEKKIPQKMQLIQQQQAGLEADKKALEEARVQLESSLAQAQQQMAENPAIAPQLQAQYRADVDRYNQMVASANKQAESMKDLARSVEADYQKADLQEYNLKSQQGGFFGASHNKIVEGVLSMASVVPDFGIDMITGLTPESMLPSIGGAAGKSRDQLAKEWKRDIIPAFKEAGMDLWRSGTTEEYEAEMNKGILGRSWLGLMQSAPAMATPMMSGIFLQVYDGAKEEMRGTEWDGVPEGEKNAMAALLALPATALERMGFSNLAANNPFVKQVMARALTNLPKNATKEQIEAVINAETTDAVMNYGIRAAGATIAEAETGGMQYVTDVAMKDMFNRFLGEDGKFELPKSWGEYAQGAIMSAAEEGIGGFIMGQLPALAAARRAKKNVGEVTTDTQFELLEETLKNPEYLPMMQEQLKRQVESAKISEAQAAETIASWKEAQQIVSKIPEDLQTEKRREAFDLLTQKAKLSKMDKALVGDKVAAIDAKLMKLAGVEPETNAVGESKAPAKEAKPVPVALGDMTIKSFAESIASGNRLDTPEAVQFYENNKKEIEAELQRMANPSTSVITDEVVAGVSDAASKISKPNEVKTGTLPNGVEYAVGVLTSGDISNKVSVVDGAANELVDRARVINIAGRWVARVKLPNGKTFPFYVSSSGTSGKDAGKWYPFFGITPSGWIAKGSMSELESEHGVPELQEISKKLNATLRIPGSLMDPITGDIVSNGTTLANMSDFGLSIVDRADANNDNEINEFLGLPPVPDITHQGGKANEQWMNTVLALAGLSAPSKQAKPAPIATQADIDAATGVAEVVEPTTPTLSSQSLQDAFGYTKEVADATEAIADAMGLDKSKIKVVKGGEAGEGALMQDEIDGWHSRLDQAIASKGNTQSGADWMKWAEARAKEGMLSMEEVKWTGLADFLQGKAKVTPKEVREFLKENRVKVEVKLLGTENETASSSARDEAYNSINEAATRADYYEGSNERKRLNEVLDAWYNDPTESNKSRLDEVVDDLNLRFVWDIQTGDPTKFSQYQLPGGTNYREVLVTLPSKARVHPHHAEIERLLPEMSAARRAGNYNLANEIDARIMQMGREIEAAGARNKTGQEGLFRSSHFDEPNILVHLRVNDRTDSDGKKVLFVEEMQSDWGQKGKKEGFDTGNRLPDGMTISKEGNEWVVRSASGEELVKGPDKEALLNEIGAQPIVQAVLQGVPSAPFVEASDAWVELGIKQAVRMAVDGGYDRIAWTTGEQQYNRWGSQVLSWTKRGDNWYVLGQEQAGGDAFAGMEGQLSEQAFSKGRQIESRDDLRELVLATMDREKKDWSPENWKKHIDKITDGIWQQMKDGKDGSTMPRREGMKGFYDKILPNVAKKVSKKLGGDGMVGEVRVPNGGRVQQLREPSGWQALGPKNEYLGLFNTESEAKAALGQAQQSITITPEMKAKVSSGVPLMQDAKGAVEFAEGGDAIIRALQNPDPSTGIHELAHVARRFLLDRNVPQENRLGITDAHIETAEQWSGAKDGNWTREAEEKFARGFERYLRDGNAPNEALKDVFAKFKQWLTDIYRNLFNSPVKEMVSPEMRKVFDALVTRGPQTKAPRTADPTVATKANDAAPEPAAPPPAEPAKPEPKEPSRPMRGSAKRMKEQYPELYAALGDDTIYYDRLPMTVTRDAASELVGWLGLERAKDEVLNRSSDIPDAVRAMMGRMVMRKLADEHRLAELDTFAENFFKLGTSAGQFINALRDVYEEFSKEMIFYRVQKIVEKEVERKKGKDKNYKKLRDGLEKVNKEVVEEVVRTRKVREKTNEAAAPQQKQSGSEKIRKAWNWDKNKVVKKDRKAEILKALRGTFGTGPNPLYVELAAGYVEAGARTFAAVAEVVASELGNKAVPYFKEAYKKAFKFLKDQGVDAGEPSTDAEIDEEIARFNTKAMVDQLRKAIASNDKKTASELIGKLQQTSKDFDAWGLYKEYAVSRLKRMADREIADDIRVDDDVREFADGLVRNITDQMKKEAEAKGLEPKEPKTPKSAIEIIGDAYRNFDKYEQVWRDTQAEWKRRLNAAEARLAKATTSEAKQKAQADIAKEKARLEKLDAYYGELMVKPFSEAAIGRAVKDGMKELNQKIDEIIRQHYTVYEAAKRSLADKLVQDAGLTEPEATKLADAVKAEFERLATERKKALVEQYAKRKFGDGKITRAERKGIEDELIFLTNTGAFSEAEFIEKYGKLRKWPKLTEENIKEIERLADRIQTAPPGRPRLEAIEDLLGYQENLSGVSKWEVAQSVWFANMLSGFETQEVNFLANQINLSAEIAVAVAKSTVKGKPVDAVNIVRALGYGFARGWYEAGAVMSTGYSPIRGRVDIPPALERYKFPKYLAMYSGLKYVRRFMVAADVLGFEPLKELRAYQYAAMKARSVDPSPIDRQKALDILNRDDSTISDAHNQAEQEYQADLKDIEARNLSAKDKKKAITKAERDKKRRAFELVELGRDPEVLQESARFAARATYNYTPEGALGVPAKMINMGLDALPALRYVIPFVNIIANVANEALNYYAPISFARALAGGPVTDTIMRRANKGMTEDQKKMHREDLLAKAMIGLVLQAAVLVLSEPGDDDDPLVEITANGYNNYKQNTEMESKGLWKPYSFRLRGTDTWISYQYTPLLFAFGMAGHLRDAVKYRKEKLDDTFLTQWAVATERNIGTITDATFLSTTADALSWLTDTKEGGLEGLAKSFAKTTKAMVVPYSALLSQIQQNMEASFGVPKIDARGSMTAELIKNTPVAYFIRDNYPIMIDALGDPIIPTGGSLRRFFSTSDPDPGLLKKLFMAAPAPDRFWRLMVDKKYPLSAPNRNTVTVYDEQEDKERLLTDQELMTFYQKRGALIKEALNDDFEALSAMDNKEFAEEMRSIQTYASEEAKWAATGGE